MKRAKDNFTAVVMYAHCNNSGQETPSRCDHVYQTKIATTVATDQKTAVTMYVAVTMYTRYDHVSQTKTATTVVRDHKTAAYANYKFARAHTGRHVSVSKAFS